MNKQAFKQKLRQKWFDSLKEGDDILAYENIYTIVNKDHMFNTVMVNKGNDQWVWYSLEEINPVPEYMNTELYKELTRTDIDES